MQDIKPRFHASRFHGSEGVEEEVCYHIISSPISLNCLINYLTRHMFQNFIFLLFSLIFPCLSLSPKIEVTVIDIMLGIMTG